MNRQELIEKYKAFLKENDLQPEEVIVGAGGACLMLGVRDETEDIDVDVPAQHFHRFKARGYITSWFRTNEIIPVTPDIDVHLRADNSPTRIIDGVCIYAPEVVLAFKLGLNRPKDQKDIEGLKRIIQQEE